MPTLEITNQRLLWANVLQRAIRDFESKDETLRYEAIAWLALDAPAIAQWLDAGERLKKWLADNGIERG